MVAFVGKLGAGKNYCAMKQIDELKDTGHTIYMISFADPIKQLLKNSFGLTKAGKIDVKLPEFTEIYCKGQIVDSLYNLIKPLNYEKFDISESDTKAYISRNYEKYEDDFYKFVKNASNNVEYSLSFRRLGQLLGTELGRYLIDSIWVDIALDKVKKVFKADLADYAYILDCRFINEYNMLEEFRSKTAFDSIVYGVSTTDETRAIRRGMTIEELIKQDMHGSEKEVDHILSIIPKELVIQND